MKIIFFIGGYVGDFIYDRFLKRKIKLFIYDNYLFNICLFDGEINKCI